MILNILNNKQMTYK